MNELEFSIACPSDASKLLEIYAPYITDTAITFEYEVPSVPEFSQRIEKILTSYPFIVAKRDNKFIGYAYASAFKERAAYDWAVEVSVYVAQNEHGRGVGKALYAKLEDILKVMGVLNLNACISVSSQNDEFLDDTSVRFHEHLGYELVGEFKQCGFKFGRWYNMIWMQKMIGEHTSKPTKVRKFSELEDKL
ncbi:GNAT family N-acetyltransferase [Campylobacter suis]|uniref:Phosphinothricin N-acetyltransferase n=1 Tax=Campylobacter suis TaxID=2790657 RepID=A0ABM8Q544_9BACT|nr:GNAT family N-acetyltransferase [Campylobacter suis]CAD7287935.1 Phosphinothricin N-acetyltransferase [Campylobacter suis]